MKLTKNWENLDCCFNAASSVATFSICAVPQSLPELLVHEFELGVHSSLAHKSSLMCTTLLYIPDVAISLQLLALRAEQQLLLQKGTWRQRTRGGCSNEAHHGAMWCEWCV
jgi:hypothetical protein